MNKRLLTIALAFSTVLITSCSKDDEPQNKTAILTAKTWMMTKAEINYKGQTMDITAFSIEDCMKDNTIKFMADGKYEENTGADDCDGDETNDSGTWAFAENETVLKIVSDSDTLEYKIVSMSSNSIKVNVGTTEYDTNGDGVEDENVDMYMTLTGK